MRILNSILFVLLLSLQVWAAPTAEQLMLKTGEGTYPVVEMGDHYKDESHTASIWSHGLIIIYFTAEQREAFRVVIVDGIVYDTAGNIKTWGDDKLKLNYVMDSAGNFYIFDNKSEKGEPRYRHSSILAGKGVAGAGEIRIDEEGKVTKIDSDSGHYSPGLKQFENVVKELEINGARLKDIKIKYPAE